jgi:epoxyqueuosine reductase QueG
LDYPDNTVYTMTAISACPISGPEITRIFSERGIDAFVIADVGSIRAPAGRHPRDLLPTARTIIIFGRVMPDLLFSGTAREQKTAMHDLVTSLEMTASALVQFLEREGSRSVPALPSLPLKIEKNMARGSLSLTHCARDASFGTLGDNTLFIHPEFGNRLALAAVITEAVLEKSPLPSSLPVCSHCNRCIDACPALALQKGKVDMLACRNLAAYLPGPLLPLARRALQWEWSCSLSSFLVNRIGPYVRVRPGCSECLVSCPYFHKGKR